MSAFCAILEQFFQLEEHNSDIVTELRAEVVTFFTSSYIIFVQPAVLSSAGMDFGAVMTATCLASAIGCLIMGLWANYPITAPVLIIVGCLMARNLVHINWRQWDEALPSYLIVVGMPLTFSIADGMALGFISYPLKLFCGKVREVHWCIYLVAILFVFRYSVS